MKRPTLEDSRKTWLSQPITTRESAYSIYSKAQDKFIDYQQSEINRLKEDRKQLLIKYADWFEDNALSFSIHDSSEKVIDSFLSQNKH